jgi:hypothetical protein
MPDALLKDFMVVVMVVFVTIGIACIFSLVLKQKKPPEQQLRHAKINVTKKHGHTKKS